jgi:hypothetical protein
MCPYARWESSGVCFLPTQTPRVELSYPWFGVCSRSACP